MRSHAAPHQPGGWSSCRSSSKARCPLRHEAFHSHIRANAGNRRELIGNAGTAQTFIRPEVVANSGRLRSRSVGHDGCHPRPSSDHRLLRGSSWRSWEVPRFVRGFAAGTPRERQAAATVKSSRVLTPIREKRITFPRPRLRRNPRSGNTRRSRFAPFAGRVRIGRPGTMALAVVPGSGVRE